MESMIVLLALFFIGGPILLLFLVLGARNRIGTLETQIDELRERMRRLEDKGTEIVAKAGGVAADAEFVAETAEMPMPPTPFEPQAPAAGSVVVEPPLPEATPAAAVATYAETTEPEPPIALATPAANADSKSDRYADATTIEALSPPAWVMRARDWLFGGNLVAKVGLLILFIGVSFLVKYAAARVTVPIEYRLCGIVLGSLGLLVWGWRIRESRPTISLPVQGGALAILMLVTFGAFRFYDLIPGSLAFALLFALTAFTCLLAVLQDALWLAVFGIAGGFAAPILASTGHGSHIGLFSYYALLNAGILAIALKRSWRLLNVLGFAFTFVIATTWGVYRYEPANYLSAQCFLALFFVFYVAIAILYAHRQAPRLRHYVDGTLVFGTPLVAFGLQYGLVRDMPFGLAFSALVLGLFYIGLTLALWRRRSDTLRLLVEAFLALGIVFGTLAIPLALDGRWTSAAWALEGAGIAWVGLRQKQTRAWVFGVVVQLGAWVSFIASMSGLDQATATRSNLRLGFLLLAGTGFVMAMNFRSEFATRGAQATADGDDAPIATRLIAWLSVGFIGFAALWLLAGAWTEIFLRAGPHRPTLLVASAVFVAALLGMVARRHAWAAPRYFALAPQLAAGAVVLWLTGFDLVRMPRAAANLFETGFPGALLITLGALVTGLAFHRQTAYASADADDAWELRLAATMGPLSRWLLGWGAYWWFVQTLGNLNAWANAAAGNTDAPGWQAHALFGRLSIDYADCAAYGVALAVTTPLYAWLARRLDWPDLRWPACAVWAALLHAVLVLLQQLDGTAALPAWPAWVAFAGLWLAGEWLLRDVQRDGWLAPDRDRGALCAIHALRTAGPWLLIWPLGHRLVSLAMGPAPAAAELLARDSAWFMSGSWSRYLPAWAMMAVVAWLVPRARREAWPTPPVADWYRHVLVPLGAAASLALAALWNVTQNGQMQPLPYLPILNPLDLTTGFAALLAIAVCRDVRDDDSGASQDHPLRRLPLPTLGAIAAYLWFNLMLLRTAAHFLAIDYRFDALFRSQFVQAMLSLVWSATALVLMRRAAGRRQRTPWLAGAGLLGLVIAKLFLVDLTNVGGIERIVSFLGVGALMLAIGYLAPLPDPLPTDEPTAKE